MTISNLHPSLILFAAAALLPFVGRLRNLLALAAPIAALLVVHQLSDDASLTFQFLGFDLELLRVNRLSKVFGYIFTLNAALVFVYSFSIKDRTPHAASLIYIGSALGVVFARDLISLYLFWETMAVASTFLVLARRTGPAYSAAMRYIMVHIFGGLLLLAGILLHIHETGSTDFDTFVQGVGQSSGSWLILLGFLTNAAAVPFSSWLPDAYPESTVTGGVILSAYTSKTAVYTLLVGFAGWKVLIPVGCVMAIYGIFYALLENDMRRILAYSIINQVGFMVCAAGIGTELAIDGAAAHAFCHILYKSLLWMSAGAVLYRTGKSKCTELGGLYKYMPWTFVLGTIGALAISGVPFTSGFTSKTIIVYASEKAHLFWPWLVLEIASAGVFLHAGIKFPYFVFFNKDRGLRPKEAPSSMLIGMGLVAFLCIFLGVYPDPLYEVLPSTGFEFHAYTFEKLVTQCQLLSFSALVFFLMLKWLKRTPTIVLDFDWVYRKVVPVCVALTDAFVEECDRYYQVYNRGKVCGFVRAWGELPRKDRTRVHQIGWAAILAIAILGWLVFV